jgi:hypothetical protein
MPASLSNRAILLLAAFVALPAHVITARSFAPFEARFRVSDDQPEFRFWIDRAQPLYLEYGLIVRAPGASAPPVVVELNGVDAARIETDRLFARSIRKIPLTGGAVRNGENVLRVRAGTSRDVTLELDGRLQNYYGIAPDFPRAFIVDDRMVAHMNERWPPIFTALRLMTFYAGCVGLIVALVRLRGGRTAPALVGAFVVAASIVPWIAVGYSVATPVHIWLSIEALIVVLLAGGAMTGAARALWRRGRSVVRVGLIVLVTLVALELALRAFDYFRPHFLFYSDSPDRFRGRPGGPFFDTRLNSGGFNDVEHAIPRPPNVSRRIVALGDSFALGVVPYSANYLTLLESELAPNGSTDVINMGVAATGPREYLTLLVSESLRWQPDIVLVNLFVGNDLEIPERRLHEYSYVAMLVRGLWSLATEPTPAADVTTSGGEYRDDQPGFGRDRFLEIQVDRSWIYAPDDGRLSRAVAAVGADLRRMRDLARRAGAEFAVVIIPDETQVNAELATEVARARPGITLNLDLPNRRLLESLSADGIRALDLLPVFRAAGSDRLYKPQDTHWNLAGNRLAARAIAQWLGAGR